jgi:rubrerythrin
MRRFATTALAAHVSTPANPEPVGWYVCRVCGLWPVETDPCPPCAAKAAKERTQKLNVPALRTWQVGRPLLEVRP